MDIKQKLQHAVTEHDRKNFERSVRNRRVYHNPNALGLYLEAVDKACEAIEQGKDIRSALVDNFCGRLLDVVLKSVGLPKSTDDEQRITGTFVQRSTSKERT